jgi:alpha 1,3-glucosidase
MSIYRVLAALLLLIALVSAMDHSKFEKCDQKGFCKRLRAQKRSHYIITNLEHNEGIVEAKLVDDQNKFNDPLSLHIEAYEHGILRFKIKEYTENSIQLLKKRYDVKDVLVDTIKEHKFEFKDDTITTKNSKLVIKRGDEKESFSMTFYVNGIEGIVINSDNLLTVESTLRPKDETPTPYPAAPTNPVPPNPDAGEGASPENVANIVPPQEKYEGESAIGLDFTFTGAQHVYGIPERATDLSLKPTRNADGSSISEPYRLYNLDIFEYELNNPIGLYGVIPLLYSIKPNLAVGFFHLNPSESFVDIYDKEVPSANLISLFKESNKAAHWISETGAIDIFLLPGPTPKAIASQMGYLTGTPRLPQRFALGYHQCRWNYKDEEDVRTVDSKFDEFNIPYDVLWLDIEHTDSKKYFTWDAHNFPTSVQMQENIASKGRKMVTITDPHIKRHVGYHVHDAATAGGHYVKTPSGTDYEGHCWPGSSSWLDFLNPKVREFYASLFHYDSYVGSTKYLYSWIDMNEPSVFSGPEVTMHKDSIHYGGLEHREVHNLYGFYQGMATYQGQYDRNNGEDRPFILSRSFFAGSQRYVAVWTGDNAAKWDHLEKATPMLLALGISGLPFVGADVGGFFGNPEPELLVRWYQAGAFSPFFRGHAHIETQRREPWLFGESNTNLIREAIAFRYTLLAHYYTLAKHSSLTTIPILRPLFMQYPNQQETYAKQDEFMVGSDLLVKPVTKAGQPSVSIYLPSGDIWYDYQTGEKLSGKEATVNTPMTKIPVLQRGGSIISTQQRMRRSSSQMKDDPFTLHIALSANLSAAGDLYWDDGHTFNYEKGDYIYQRFDFQNNRLVSRKGDLAELIRDDSAIVDKSSYVAPRDAYRADIVNTVERIIVKGYPKEPRQVSLVLEGTGASTSPEAVQLRSTLGFEYDKKNGRLTIRKPNAKITQDWSILIE